MTALGTPDVDASRRLGSAAVQAMLAVASESSVGAVIEANLRRRTEGDLWQGEIAEPVPGGWPLLEVDTAQPVDLGVVVAFVRDRTRLSAP
jgi:hypothetical protein